MLVLNPFAGQVVCKTDKNLVDSLCVIDCSWNKAQAVLTNYKFLKKGVVRRIPALLAGNPVNYARLGRLSSVESMSAFLELNHDALEDYSAADNRKEVMKIESEYFGSKILENNV
jgi:pre-rRNA-processing protein TSR3